MLAMPSRYDDLNYRRKPKLHASPIVLMTALLAPLASEAATISFDSAAYSVEEGGSVTVGITLQQENNEYGGECTVTGNVVRVSGTATAGEDYTIPNPGFSINVTSNMGPQTYTATVTVDINSDSLVENSETIVLGFQGVSNDCHIEGFPFNVQEGSPNQTTITIIDQTISEDPFDNASLTPNQRAVLSGLRSACSNATGQLLQRCQEITSIEALDAIIPDEISAQGSTAADFGLRQLELIHGRIVELRNAKKSNATLLGYSTIDVNGETLPVGKTLLAAMSQLLGGGAGDDPDEVLRDSPLGLFIKGQFNIGNRDMTINQQGFDIVRKSITLGLDYTFFDSLVLGAAFGYGFVDTDFHNNNGRMETNSYDFATYGSYFLPEDFYVDWIMSYSVHDYDTKRNIRYSGLDTTATSRPGGDQFGFAGSLGKDFAFTSYVINPYARFEYLSTSVDAYRESGGAGLALEVDKQVIQSLTSTIGTQISRAFGMPWGVLSPGARFEWVHQYKNDDRGIQARFANAAPGTGNFVIRTDSPDRDYFNLGGSLTATLPEGRAGFLRYETRLGQAHISDHTVELGLRIPF